MVSIKKSSKAIERTENAVPTFIWPLQKKPKSTTKQQNELLSLACNYLSNEKNTQYLDLHQAKIWANTLNNTMTPNQKPFAQKAINVILFGAQLGTLHNISVKINENCTRSPITLSRWKESSFGASSAQSQDCVFDTNKFTK